MKNKNPISFLVFFLLVSIVSFGQTRSNTPGFSARANQSFVVEDGYLSARNALFTPRFDDSTQANTFLTAINKDTIGNVIYLYSTQSLWMRTIASGSTKKWVEIGGVYTASEGITKTGNDFQIGGTLNSNRQITWDYGNKIFQMNTSTGMFQDMNIQSTDSIVNNPETSSEANTSAFAVNKTWKYPSYTTQYYRVGSILQTNYEAKDSVRLNSYGGDFGSSLRVDLNFKKMPGYSGRSVYVMGAQTLNDALPVNINYVYMGTGSTTSNYKYVKGYVTGNQSMLYIAAADTIENWVGFNNMAGFFGTSHIKFSADYAGGYFGSASAAQVANPWGVFIWNARSKNYFAGSVGIGDSTIESSALVDISSTTKGILPPRMTSAQKIAISSPANSLFLWDTDSLRYMGYNGTAWKGIAWTGEGGGSGSGTVNSGTAGRLGYYATTGTAISEAAAITANRALISDVNGVPTHSATTATQLGYLNAATGTTGTASTNLVFSTSPTFTTNITAPIVYGSSAASGSLQLNSTSNATKGGIFFKSQTSGISISMSDLTAGEVAFGNVASGGSAPSFIAKSTLGYRFTSGTDDANTSGDLIFNARRDNNADYATLTNDAFVFSRFATTLMTIKRNGNISVAGNLSLNTAGNKLSIATGTNASIGTATLAAGTVTVSTTAVTASSKIFVTVNTPGGTQGFISVPDASITTGTSFVINSTSATETSTVNYFIIN